MSGPSLHVTPDPFHNAAGTGTLYTASYYPGEGRVEMRWPSGEQWTEGFDAFVAREHTEIYDTTADGAPATYGPTR